jgi:hypothetical protein
MTVWDPEPEDEAPWMFDADLERPVPRCFCNHCQSEGRIDPDSSCLFFRGVDCGGE